MNGELDGDEDLSSSEVTVVAAKGEPCGRGFSVNLAGNGPEDGLGPLPRGQRITLIIFTVCYQQIEL